MRSLSVEGYIGRKALAGCQILKLLCLVQLTQQPMKLDLFSTAATSSRGSFHHVGFADTCTPSPCAGPAPATRHGVILGQDFFATMQLHSPKARSHKALKQAISLLAPADRELLPLSEQPRCRRRPSAQPLPDALHLSDFLGPPECCLPCLRKDLQRSRLPLCSGRTASLLSRKSPQKKVIRSMEHGHGVHILTSLGASAVLDSLQLFLAS